MAKEKVLPVPTGVSGDYHPITRFEIRRDCNGSNGSVVVDVCQYVSHADRTAGRFPLMTRQANIPLASLNQATLNAFMADLWTQTNLVMEQDIASGEGQFKDFGGMTDVFEPGQP